MEAELKQKKQVFQFDGAKVRVVVKDGEPWFVATDVAAILGYSDVSRAVQTHCKDKTLYKAPGDSPNTTGSGRGGLRAGTPLNIIPESDVYRLIMRSKLPSAERFEEWVVAEVLPTIRKHGVYMTPEKIKEGRLHLFFAYTPLCTSLMVKRGSKSVLDRPLIPWKYRGFYVGAKVGARRRELVLTGKSLKVYEGAREDLSPRGVVGRSVPERSRLGVLSERR